MEDAEDAQQHSTVADVTLDVREESKLPVDVDVAAAVVVAFF